MDKTKTRKKQKVAPKEPRKICASFDGGCFSIIDKQACFNGGIKYINGSVWWTSYEGDCPFLGPAWTNEPG